MANQQSQQTLVARLKRMRALTSPMVEAAFMAHSRAQFLPAESLADAYRDLSLPIKHDGSGVVEIASTQPSMTARMLEQLRLQAGQNVLQLGAGSGYTAALIQHVVGEQGRVTAIEIDPSSAQQAADNLQRASMSGVLVVQADAAGGYAPRANYDRILANASIWDVPPAWVSQLKPDGVLVAPLWLDGLQYSAAFCFDSEGYLYSQEVVPCSFIPLRGSAAGPRMTLRIGGSSLALSGDVARLDSAALHVLLSEAADIDYLAAPLPRGGRRRNFLPALMLGLPPEYAFCLYTFEGDQLPYGMNRRGFAAIAPGSAAFISLEGDFKSFIFGSADAFIAVDSAFKAWQEGGKPDDRDLRLKLLPHDAAPASASTRYRIYRRPHHDLHVWLNE
jgi:protein-L-isoaspartate(D-aspartate) O-methyltransferase